ncbi:hypothetical protein [Roseofilum sp. Guam]|uniref:hypothetical protein n=1 Tax=Roseofilum sp. Guam TaxID=2821502 RepID=UPI001B2F38CE|nr:hypothetical protein [Roseofilum sp. Guam]MBP0031436.1 hypothetical protein [Roseofilum sp. Guam]
MPRTTKQIRVPAELEHHVRAYLTYLKELEAVPPPVDFEAIGQLERRCNALESSVSFWERLSDIRQTLHTISHQINEKESMG